MRQSLADDVESNRNLAAQKILQQLCAHYGVAAYGKRDAPGVYVKSEPLSLNPLPPGGAGDRTREAKIASLGLKIRNGCSYHGVALNVDMDLAPFALINPCGFEGLRVTQLREFAADVSIDEVGGQLAAALERALLAALEPPNA